MASTAPLKLILKAGDAVVAESEDPQLWQDVLHVIHGHARLEERRIEPPPQGTPPAPPPVAPSARMALPPTPLARFAQRVGVSEEQAQAACRPSAKPPFLHLDADCFAALKEATPARGSNAVSSIALAATLLALWTDAAGFQPPTLAQVQAALAPLGRKDRNPERGLANCAWLRFDGRRITLHTARADRAEALARAFCRKEPPRP